MTTDNLKKINSVLELGQLRRAGSEMLKGQEKKVFQGIQESHDKLRTDAEQLYRHEYKTRVNIATRKLQNEAGAKKLDLKPSFFGIDRFNKSDLNRQAQINVRLDPQQTMDRLDAQEMKKSQSFLSKCSQRKIFLEIYKKSAERRRTQTRRQGHDRRHSQTQE